MTISTLELERHVDRFHFTLYVPRREHASGDAYQIAAVIDSQNVKSAE